MPIDKEIEERLANLEMRNAFQERAIEQLSAEMVRQQNQIDELSRRSKEILSQIDPGVVGSEIEKPPHY